MTPLIWEAAHIVVESQRGLHIWPATPPEGWLCACRAYYGHAGEKGVVGPPDGSKPREVLLDEEGLAALESVDAEMAREDREFGGF